MATATPTSLPALTAPERQALLRADPNSGRLDTVFRTRESLCRKGYAYRSGHMLLLTDYGRSLRRRLVSTHQEFHIDGVPWSKAQEITELYLQGLTIEEISRRSRVTGDGVEAVLAHRQVLVGS
jgi:hypothetical protein